MIRINLLPPEYAAAQAKKEQQIIFGSLGGVVVLILVLVWGGAKLKANRLETEVRDLQSELKKYRTIKEEIDRKEALKKKLLAKRNVIQDLTKSRLVYPVLFEDLLPLIPPEVWFKNLDVKNNGPRMRLNFQSQALSNFSLATWLTNLEQSKHFANVKLAAISYTTREEGQQVLRFNLSCSYEHKGPMPLKNALKEGMNGG